MGSGAAKAVPSSWDLGAPKWVQVRGTEQHVSQLKNGPTVLSYELTCPRLVELGENRVLLTYKAMWIRLKDGVAAPQEDMFVSSVWEYRANRWLNIFSQDTPAA